MIGVERRHGLSACLILGAAGEMLDPAFSFPSGEIASPKLCNGPVGLPQPLGCPFIPFRINWEKSRVLRVQVNSLAGRRTMPPATLVTSPSLTGSLTIWRPRAREAGGSSSKWPSFLACGPGSLDGVHLSDGVFRSGETRPGPFWGPGWNLL
jgi:hypothetical protein